MRHASGTYRPTGAPIAAPAEAAGEGGGGSARVEVPPAAGPRNLAQEKEDWFVTDGAAPAGDRLVPRPVARHDTRLINGVYDRLRSAIVNGEIGPETRLLQQQLAVSLGVSRTPLREALLRLERDGFLYSVPNRGMFVRGLTIEEIGELYQLRELLEPVAARLACEVADKIDVARVKAMHRELERRRSSSLQEAFNSNFGLHTSLIRSCPNQRMAQFLRDIWDQNSAFLIFRYYARNVGAAREMVCEHGEIVDAFAAGDGHLVEELLRSHIRCAAESLLASLRETGQREREA